MLFNSYQYILFFLPVTFIVYFLLTHKRLTHLSKAWLVFASLFFYSWWNPVYLPLILTSMLFNYGVGTTLSNTKYNTLGLSKKTLLIIGVTINLLALGYFKYVDFFITNLNYLGANIDLLNVVLPLAISFFTFQQIAYLVDSYRNETQEYDFLNYALFVTFFPQLIAGPIVHHKEMMPQFANRWNLVKKYKNIALGLFIFSMGLFKKVAIADYFSQFAIAGFDTTDTLTFAEAWVSSLSYCIQIYFDFSGYTDMAIGAALLFNIYLPINFNSPYKAISIQDFWRRWHLTLSRFLRDYVYIPLGGSRKGSLNTYLNIFLTFLIGGIWHGAGWMYVAWGASHGLGLMVHRLWQTLGIQMPKALAIFITFNYINITMIIFRSENFEKAYMMLKSMVDFSSLYASSKTLANLPFIKYLGFREGAWNANLPFISSNIILWVTLAMVFVLTAKNTTYYYQQRKINLKYTLLGAAAFSYAFITSMKTSTEVFLYFNF